MRFLSLSQMSEATGFDRRTIKERLAQLTPKVEGRSHLYDAREALPLLYRASQDNDKANSRRLLEEQLRYETERADKIALQNTKLRGGVVSIEEVAGVVEGEYAAVKAALLSIPYKSAGELATMDNVIEIKKLLDGLLNEALSELSADEKAPATQYAGPEVDETD